jgi:hypothetical protein
MSNWLYEGKEFAPNLDEILEKGWVGFVYLLTNLETGKKYIGKKLLTTTIKRAPLKGQKRKRKTIKESDWQTYCSSSEKVKELVEEKGLDLFKREILCICKSKGDLSYMELYHQIISNSLLDDDYYNGIVQARINAKHLKNVKELLKM